MRPLIDIESIDAVIEVLQESGVTWPRSRRALNMTTNGTRATS